MNSETLMVVGRDISLFDILDQTDLVARFDIDRFVTSRAVKVNDQIIEFSDEIFTAPDTLTIEVGKRRQLTVFLIPVSVLPFR